MQLSNFLLPMPGETKIHVRSFIWNHPGNVLMIRSIVISFLLLCIGGAKLSADDALKVTFDTKWGGERLILPTGFAPDLSLRGIEEIRFAPGMFEPDQEDFFSYSLVFYLPKQKPLIQNQIHTELLKYYRGLASAVGKDRIPKIDTDKFTLVLTKVKGKEGQYTAVLDWVEPFRTGKAQKLRFEIESAEIPGMDASRLSMSASPQKADHKLWTVLRKVTASAKFSKVSK